MQSFLRAYSSVSSTKLYPACNGLPYSVSVMLAHMAWKSSVTWSLAIATTASLLGVAAPLLALETTAPVLGSPVSSEPVQTTERRPTVPVLISPVLISQVSDDTLLQLEDAGEAVTQLQTRLANLGYYDGPISGVFGELTQAAVINFQQQNGLSPDGIVGAETFAAIDRGAAPATSTAEGSSPSTTTPVAAGGIVLLGNTGSDVTTLQQRLTTLGYYQGAVDGQFGAQTEAALLAFQRAQGLNPDGIAGTATFSALNALTTPAAIAAAPTTPSTTLPPAQPDAAFPSPPGLGGQATLPQTTQMPAPAPIQPLPDVGVLELQRQLTRQGLYSGPLDGILNAETQQAIAEAQRVHGINSGDINGQF